MAHVEAIKGDLHPEHCSARSLRQVTLRIYFHQSLRLWVIREWYIISYIAQSKCGYFQIGRLKRVFFNLLFYSRKSFNAKHPSVSCSSEKLFQFLFIGVQQLFGVLMAHTLVMIWSTSYSRPSGVINE